MTSFSALPTAHRCATAPSVIEADLEPVPLPRSAQRPGRNAGAQACVLGIDLSPNAFRTPATTACAPNTLIGRQILCACDFAPKRAVAVRLEAVVTDAYDDQAGVVLAGFDHPAANGTRVA